MMSVKNIALVDQFSGLQSRMSPSRKYGWSSCCLAESADYAVVVAKSAPIHSTFHGRREVESYLYFVSLSYQVVESEPKILTADAGSVIVQGGEVAHLSMANEHVRTRWIAVYEIENDLITKVWMSIYGWTMLAAAPEITRASAHRAMPTSC